MDPALASVLQTVANTMNALQAFVAAQVSQSGIPTNSPSANSPEQFSPDPDSQVLDSSDHSDSDDDQSKKTKDTLEKVLLYDPTEALSHP